MIHYTFPYKILRKTPLTTKNILFFSILCIVIYFCRISRAEPVIWSYYGKHGPKYWGVISPSYQSCRSGYNQSPINIDKPVKADLKPLKFYYYSTIRSIDHAGFAVQLTLERGNTLEFYDTMYRLRKIYFRTPSEHKVYGQTYPAEIQFFHESSEQRVLIVSIMVQTADQTTNEIGRLFSKLPSKPGATISLVNQKYSPSILIPDNKNYFLVNGSLTMPPCTEGVYWLILKSSIGLEKTIIQKLMEVIGGENIRPVQDVNARFVLQ